MRLFALAAHLGDCHADTATALEYMVRQASARHKAQPA